MSGRRHIVKQTAQPISGSAKKQHHGPEKASKHDQDLHQGRPYQPALPGHGITFTGKLVAGDETAEYSLTVLAGEGAPTVTDGFAKWSVIDRPQRVGMTVLQGYNPIVMSVPIVFEASTGNAADADGVEYGIQILEWMAGRGVLFAAKAEGGVGHPGQGDSPLVTLTTLDGNLNPVPLVPLQYQNPNWVLTGLAYDQNPERDVRGRRTRQKVVVTLTEHVGSPGTSADSATARNKAAAGLAGQIKTYPITTHNDTIKKIMVLDAQNTVHADQVAVMKLNRARPKIGKRFPADINKSLLSLPHGTLLQVPEKLVGKHR